MGGHVELKYKRIKGPEFFEKIKTEVQARDWVWRSRFEGKEFVCPECKSEEFYQYVTEPEIRKCQECHRYVRLRVGTIFQHSHLPLLTWVRAIWWVMQGKRGISALELKRQLGMTSYGTTWVIMNKIRRALQERDDRYKLKNLIELDGAYFGRKENNNQTGVLVGIETKSWVDERGKTKSRAGFAKVMVKPETAIYARAFVDGLTENALVNTDANNCYQNIPEADCRVMKGDQQKINDWLPWVHKFISNAKTWLMGTHHRATSKYVGLYLSEYTYRFNRRHDQDSLFHRALTACALAKPCEAGMLFG